MSKVPRTLCPLTKTLALALLGTSSALASGVEPTKLSLPKGPASIEGLGRSFSASLASGTASYGVDIAVPPSASGFAPKLSLEYDAGGGVSELGMGWRLGGLPSIRRRTNEGLPTFTEADAFELTGVGTPSDLLEMTDGFFRPELESGAFARVQRSADGSTWEARAKGGTIYRFGGKGFVEAEGSKVFAYLLREQLDLHGHRIAYEWDTESGETRLVSVTWNDFGEKVRQRIVLSYEERPDHHELFSTGIRRVLTQRVAQIDVTLGGELVRRYSISYAEGPHSRVESVTMVGTDGETALPSLSFEYTEASFAADGQVTTMKAAPTRSPADRDVQLADLNGDGLPDLLVAKSGGYRSYVNHDGTLWQAGQDWAASDSPSVSLSEIGSQLADLDGDGAVDLVVKSGGTSFRYLPGQDATHFGEAVHLPTIPSFSFEDADVRLADMDGDRRTDVVVTTKGGLAISYNLAGADFTPQETIGVVDEKQPLYFSDGKTQLCDINGDRVQDFCYLRSDALTYWLGRGRGVFESARKGSGVPEYDESSPWRLLDLDGDGWVDLVHVGVNRVSYALAEGAGVFGEVRAVQGTPEQGPNVTVEFADMNGSGTTDIVWIDPTASSDGAWKYLELFPKGRAGLLRTIDNGLGKITRIGYEPAALSAAKARGAGEPWTTRMNVGMPVVSRIETDTSLGDPLVVVRYTYQDGTWDPLERTFAGFGGGVQTEVGDEHTPTLLTESAFDTGLVRRTLRGAPLWTEQRAEDGYVFSRTTHAYTEQTLGRGTDGRAVLYAYPSSKRTELVEGADRSLSRTLLEEVAQDEYGNVVEERKWGEVVGEDALAGSDEALVSRTFANNVDDWLLGYVASEELTDAAGNRVSMKRSYYDGKAFEGLPLGQVARGDLTRQEEWVGPALDAFVLDTATKYNADGQPVETRDAGGGGRIYVWDAEDRTTLLSEEVKLGGDVQLIETAVTDRRFGSLLSAFEYNGQKSRYEYDALGRLVKIWKPGDSASQPSTQYTYELGAKLSRILTDVRVWPGRDAMEHSEALFDGQGRKRGSLAQDGDKWVLAGVTLLDARGEPRRALRPRFIDASLIEDPPLLEDAPGSSSWRDASKRVVRTRSVLGIETRTEHGPLVTRAWDGGQTDPSSPYEHTPSVETKDGLGRVLSVTRTLDGAELTASFRYDAAGKLIERQDPEGNVARYAYDGRGLRTLVDDPDLGRRVLVYDDSGNLIERRNPDGNVVKYTFDLAGRSLTEDFDGDGKPEVVNTWDRKPGEASNPLYRGKLARTTEPSGETEHEYDERGRVTWTHLTILGKRYSSGSLFDNLDREYLHIYPDHSSLRIHRNARGQLAGYGDAVEVFFDGDGVEMERRFNTGVVQKLGYDDDRRLDELVAKSSAGRVIEHLKWDFDDAGNLRALLDLRDDVSEKDDRTEAYTYDNLYRLRSAEGAWGKTEWGYSPSGNLTRRKSSVPSQNASILSYAKDAGPHALTGLDERRIIYDPLGRMRSDGERTYTWNGADQLVKVSAKSGSVIENEFDAQGKRRLRTETTDSGKTSITRFISPWEEVVDGKLRRYVVHVDRRIARLADKNGAPSAMPRAPELLNPNALGFLQFAGRLWLAVAVLFALLAMAARKRARAALTMALPVFALVALSACSDGVGDASSPTIHEGTVRALSDSDTLIFTDQLGTVLSETTGNGTPKARFVAYPYGVARQDTSTESRQYADAPRDGGVGLDLMGARFYAPDLGVWTAGDPILVTAPEKVATGEFGTANAYAYANLNPVIAKDETGNFWHVVAGAIAGGVGNAAYEAASQYIATGKVEDWGRVGAAAAGGAIAGALVAAAPGAGIAHGILQGAVGVSTAGVATRLINSGGKSAGTVKQVATEMAFGAASVGTLRGAQVAGAKSVADTAGRGTIVSATRVQNELVARGYSKDVAKGFSSSFEGPITARTTYVDEVFLRYTTRSGTKGNFLCGTSFETPSEAVQSLNLAPYGNSASVRQIVFANSPSLVFEGRVAGGAAAQTLVVDKGAFTFGLGVKF